MEIIVVRNELVGGAGCTTLAAHSLFFAAELGLKVAGASIDARNDLRPWLRLAGLPWFDALCDELPDDVDLLVIDVGYGAKSVEVLRPSLTLIPVDREAAERGVAAIAAASVGNVMRVRNFSRGVALSDQDLAPEPRSLDVVLSRCDMLAATAGTLRAVWSSTLGAASSGARTIREFAAEALHRVGLLPPEYAPYEQKDRPTSLAEREKQGCARLAAFFERFAATKKAEEEEACRPTPGMVDLARDIESSLSGNRRGKP